MFSSLWHLLHPQLCPMCGSVLCQDEEELCLDCIGKLPRTEHASHRDNSVEQLFAGEDKFVRGGAFCYYRHDDPFTDAIHEMKYGSRPEIGLVLGQMAGREWENSGFFTGIDSIIPLPLHVRRLRDRGYNQAEWIARGLGEVTGLPVLTDSIRRTVNNAQQAFMTNEERRMLPQIFEVADAAELRGRHVLIVDDVLTTGSTIRSAIKTLHPVRGCKVSVFVLARTVQETDNIF